MSLVKASPGSPLGRLIQSSNGRRLGMLAAGALAPLGFAPLNLWPLTLVSMLLFLVLCRDSRRPLLDGWLYGLGFYGLGTSWVFVSIHEFGPAPIWLASLLTLAFVAAMALFLALPAWLLARLAPRRPLTLLLIFPALWVLAEFFRSHFLTGFPWLLSGYAFMDTWLQGWAPLAGVYGLSYLAALSTALLALLTLSRSWSRRLMLGALLGLPWALGAGLTSLSWVEEQHRAPLAVTLIQGATPQATKWQPERREAILQDYVAATLEAGKRDLIVWPETAIPAFIDRARPRLAALEKRLEKAGTGLITGVPSRQREASGDWRYHNSILGLGAASGQYHKQRLVPFGEYVPLEDWLRGLIRFFDLPMSSFSLGPDNQGPLRYRGLALAPSICYEIVYPELVRATARYSDLLITLSNDAWFGDSLAPHQHLQMARMRALENGRPLLRATNDGITAIVDARGRVQATAPRFVPAVLDAEVRLVTGITPYSRFGIWPLVVFIVMSLAGGLLIKLRKRLQLTSCSR